MQVMFRDEGSMTLLSASVDGQLAVFDLSVGIDEDDAFQVGVMEALSARVNERMEPSIPGYATF